VFSAYLEVTCNLLFYFTNTPVNAIGNILKHEKFFVNLKEVLDEN
jgi:hypothetical protein